ncbi:type II secretion system protein C [Legionella massiliensis]|uniref:Type II secretion system protein C n=1 Tax=Legionella massiliensis TaxID=1034943 RepID=A0A078L232_9GAMM|nr:type II secretion system protein N [Legionella massiliensis]CDZ78119.1 type II secretion system protein C [Legionella massiliensis]CEE13857.1 hypothetical protein BN1094_02426 [Legionella massiliensis]
MNQSKLSIIDFQDPKKLAASIVLVVAFLGFIGEIISSFKAKDQIITNTQPLAVSKQEPIRPNSPLFTTALFGDYVPVNLSEAEIKQSMLDVKIVGIMFSGEEKDSQVVLQISDGKEEYFVIGDTLPGGAVIKRISPEGVVVLHNGSLESLSLPKNELIFDPPDQPLIKE